MSCQRVIGLLALIVLTAGCGKESGNTNVISFRSSSGTTGTLTLRNDELVLHAPSVPDARIDAAGDLSIGKQPTAINPAQRALLQDYYRNALAAREHGMLTGKAGVAIAGQAIKSVAAGIANGNMDNIDKEIDAKAQKVTRSALNICHDLAGIKTAQDSLADQLAAFKPYAAIIDASAIADCADTSSK